MRDVKGCFNYFFYYLFLPLRINELLSKGEIFISSVNNMYGSRRTSALVHISFLKYKVFTILFCLKLSFSFILKLTVPQHFTFYLLNFHTSLLSTWLSTSEAHQTLISHMYLLEIFFYQNGRFKCLLFWKSGNHKPCTSLLLIRCGSAMSGVFPLQSAISAIKAFNLFLQVCCNLQ